MGYYSFKTSTGVRRRKTQPTSDMLSISSETVLTPVGPGDRARVQESEGRRPDQAAVEMGGGTVT